MFRFLLLLFSSKNDFIKLSAYQMFAKFLRSTQRCFLIQKYTVNFCIIFLRNISSDTFFRLTFVLTQKSRQKKIVLEHSADQFGW